MRGWKWIALALASIATLSHPAVAQSVMQSGLVTPGHSAAWRANGVIGDAGGSSAPTQANQGAIFGGLNVLGGACVEDGYNSLTLSPSGYHQLCLFPNSLGGGLISYQAENGATPLGLNFNINGVTYPIGAVGGNVIGPTNPSPTALDAVLWNGSTTVKDGGAPAAIDIRAATSAKCDGVTDDTAAFTSLMNAINAANGYVTVLLPPNSNCVIGKGLTFNDGATHNLLPAITGATSGVSVEGNGSTITVASTIANANTNVIVFGVQTSTGRMFSFRNVKFVQSNPVTFPAPSPYGIIGVYADSGDQFYLANLSLSGGAAVADFSGGTNCTVENFYSQDSIYGAVTPGGCSRGRFSGRTNHVDRSMYTYCTQNQEWQITSVNSLANDALVRGCASPTPTTNIDIQYTVLARTIGTYGASYASHVVEVSNDIISNIHWHLDIDMSGDNNGLAGEAILFQKGTTSALGSVADNITFDGVIRNLGGSYGGIPIQWNRAADAPWNGESQSNIRFSVTEKGTAPTPDYFNLAPFANSSPGLVFDHSIILDNPTYQSDSGGAPSSASTAVVLNTVKNIWTKYVSAVLNSSCRPIGGAMNSDSNTQAAGTTRFWGVSGVTSSNAALGVTLSSETGGGHYLRDLYVNLSAAPTGSETDTLAILAGGSTTGTPATTITGAVTQGSDTSTVGGPYGNGGIVMLQNITSGSAAATGLSWTVMDCTP